MTQASFGARSAKRIASVFSTDLLVLVFGLVNTILATRLLGPSGRGVVVLALNVSTVVQTLSTLGLPWAVNYYAARDRGDVGSRGHVGWLVLRFAPLLMACWAVSYLVIYIVRDTPALKGMSPTVIALSGALSLLLLAKQMQTSFLAGLHDFRRRNVVWVTTPGVAAALLVGNLALGLRLTPALVLWMNVIGAVLATSFGFYALVVGHGAVAARHEAGAEPREFLAYGTKFYVGLIAQTLNYRLGMFLVNAVLGTREVGLYATAVSVTELLLLVPNAVNVVVYPTIASLKGEQRDRVALLSTGATLYAIVALGLVWMIVAAPLIPWVFGPKFAGSVQPALWLVPGMAGIAVVRVLCHAAAGAGRPEVLTYTTLAGLAFTVPLQLALIPYLGIVGAALGSTIAYSASAIMAVKLYAGITECRAASVWARMLVAPVQRAGAAVRSRLARGDVAG
jgi:O-antigen/teichoic acid export membrane protein